MARSLFAEIAGEAKKAVKEVRIVSTLMPTVVIDMRGEKPIVKPPSGKAKQPAAQRGLLHMVRPAVEVDTDFGPIHVAPYGKPDPGRYYPAIAGTVVGAASLLIASLATVAGQGLRGLAPLALSVAAGGATYLIERSRLTRQGHLE